MLKKYKKIWDKIKSLFKKEFDTNPIYINRYIDAKRNGTEFENGVLKDNKHCNILIEPKTGSRYEYYIHNIIRFYSYLSRQSLFK